MALERYARQLLEYRVFEEKNEKVVQFIEQCVTRPDPRYVKDLTRVLYAMRRELTQYHLFDHVKRLTLPTLVIYGACDRLLPTKQVPQWAGALPAGELEVIEQCGHMPIIEKPEAVVARMKPFLARTAATAAASEVPRAKTA